MEFDNNVYRFFYYVVYATPTSRGAMNVSTESLIKTYEDIMILRDYIQNQLEIKDIVIENWKILEA